MKRILYIILALFFTSAFSWQQFNLGEHLKDVNNKPKNFKNRSVSKDEVKDQDDLEYILLVDKTEHFWENSSYFGNPTIIDYYDKSNEKFDLNLSEYNFKSDTTKRGYFQYTLNAKWSYIDSNLNREIKNFSETVKIPFNVTEERKLLFEETVGSGSNLAAFKIEIKFNHLVKKNEITFDIFTSTTLKQGLIGFKKYRDSEIDAVIENIKIYHEPSSEESVYNLKNYIFEESYITLIVQTEEFKNRDNLIKILDNLILDKRGLEFNVLSNYHASSLPLKEIEDSIKKHEPYFKFNLIIKPNKNSKWFNEATAPIKIHFNYTNYDLEMAENKEKDKANAEFNELSKEEPGLNANKDSDPKPQPEIDSDKEVSGLEEQKENPELDDGKLVPEIENDKEMPYLDLNKLAITNFDIDYKEGLTEDDFLNRIKEIINSTSKKELLINTDYSAKLLNYSSEFKPDTQLNFKLKGISKKVSGENQLVFTIKNRDSKKKDESNKNMIFISLGAICLAVTLLLILWQIYSVVKSRNKKTKK